MSCPADPSLDLEFPIADAAVTLPADGPVELRCTVRGAELQFAWSVDGGDWQDVGPLLDASILSDEAGRTEHANFTGAFVGMACQDVSGQGRHADFEYFTYREVG
jgi:xylan 1,4-beta-xylosidase